MANHPSALKAHRQSQRRQTRNNSSKSELRTALKKFTQQLNSGKTEDARAALPALYSIVDKAVAKKALSRNAAARQKSRLTQHLNESLRKADKE